MDRHFLFTLVALVMISAPACGQTFSKDETYIALYKSRFNPEFKSTCEPTLALWWIIIQFGNAEIPRDKLLEYLSQHAKLFPDSEHAERVKSHLRVVERMLDESRPKNETRIEQLIYDLRELNMRQFMQPNSGLRIIGEGSLRFDVPGGKPNPKPDAVKQLYDIGYDAIPLLIEHIDDDTLTRSVDYWRNFTFSHHVLSVGECCSQIIDSILPTTREFDFSSDAAAAKKAMKDHYRELVEQKAEIANAPKDR